MDLSIVIVSYNAVDFLRVCLHSVFSACDEINAEVFVVDNNSSDASVEMTQQEFPLCKVIANKHNPGFAIANNQAIRISKGKYILILNPDTIVAEDTFKKVLSFMENTTNAGGLGIKMLDGSGLFLPESMRGVPSPWVSFCKMTGLSSFFPTSKIFSEYHKGYLDSNQNQKVEVLAGAFMCLRRTVLDKVGLLDEDFFMYGEDIDLSYRIIKAGYQNYYFADSSIIHFKGESTNKDKTYRNRFYKAMIQFAAKHFRRSYGLLLRVFIYGGIFVAKLLSAIIFSDSSEVKGMLMEERLLYLKPVGAQSGCVTSLKNKIKAVTAEDLILENGGVLIFSLEQIEFRIMIQIMEKYKAKFQYRFLCEHKRLMVGSDKKDTKGQVNCI